MGADPLAGLLEEMRVADSYLNRILVADRCTAAARSAVLSVYGSASDDFYGLDVAVLDAYSAVPGTRRFYLW